MPRFEDDQSCPASRTIRSFRPLAPRRERQARKTSSTVAQSSSVIRVSMVGSSQTDLPSVTDPRTWESTHYILSPIRPHGLATSTDSRFGVLEGRSMKRAQERPAMQALGSPQYWPAFNLFRHKLTPDLGCAVPEDYPVPAFLDASTWAFAGKVSEPTTIPLGFKSKAAEAGVRFN